MVAVGSVAVVVTARRGMPVMVPVALGYFAAMEALQVAGYAVADQCGSAANETVTLLSILHIVFQPFIINGFAMAMVQRPVGPGMRVVVFTVCALSAAVMLLQLYPFDWAGSCRPGDSLCGQALCTITGTWHIAWDVPYNGLMLWFGEASGMKWGFPTYILSIFALPLVYGAWRFAVFHLLIGPVLASQLTDAPNEVPAVWCLLSIGIGLLSLSPWLWRRFEGRRAPA